MSDLIITIQRTGKYGSVEYWTDAEVWMEDITSALEYTWEGAVKRLRELHGLKDPDYKYRMAVYNTETKEVE